MTAVAEVVVDLLVAAGVRRAYTVPGESFLPLLDALDRHPDITLVSTRHESGAAFMAEADAKLTGVPAVVLATRGVGAANAAIGVHTADQDSTPMVVLLGQVDSANLGREAFQEVDLPRFYAELTKWSATATSAAEIPALVTRAIHTATTGRPGPTMLALPADLLTADVPAPPVTLEQGGGGRAAPGPVEAGAAAAIAEALIGARAPVLIAGGGVQGAREQLVAVVERFGCGVYAAFRRQDVFPNDHPGYCGVLTIGTAPETLAALRDADVVLAVGTRLSEITTQGYRLPRPEQRLVQIDIEPRSIGAVFPVETGMVADAAAALDAVLARAPREATARDWSAAHEAFVQRQHAHLARGTGDPPRRGDGGAGARVPARHDRRQRRGQLLGVRPSLLALHAPAHAAGADLRGDGVRRAGRGRRGAGRAGPGGARARRRRRVPDERPGAGDRRAARARVHRRGVPQRALRDDRAAPGARPRPHGRGRDRRGRRGAGLARAYGAAAWCPATLAELDMALAEARRCGRPAVVDVVTDRDVLSPTATLSGLLAKERA